MKCVLCDQPAWEGDESLGLCAWHHRGFQAEAKQAAEALERDEPGAEERARHIFINRFRLAVRAEMAPVKMMSARLQRIREQREAEQPQKSAAPQEGVLAGMIEEGEQQ